MKHCLIDMPKNGGMDQNKHIPALLVTHWIGPLTIVWPLLQEPAPTLAMVDPFTVMLLRQSEAQSVPVKTTFT